MIHDAFQPLTYWNNFMPSPQFEGVLLDTHYYQMFSVAVRRSLVPLKDLIDDFYLLGKSNERRSALI